MAGSRGQVYMQTATGTCLFLVACYSCRIGEEGLVFRKVYKEWAQSLLCFHVIKKKKIQPT